VSHSKILYTLKRINAVSKSANTRREIFEACIFDIGGTLVRAEEALLGAIKETLLENKLAPPPDDDISIHFDIGHRKGLLSKRRSQIISQIT
jgi:hypothetical protein